MPNETLTDYAAPLANTPALTEKNTFWGFTPNQLFLLVCSISIGLLFRWIGLGDRPYHHDESLHGMYGRYFFDAPDFNYYHYDPMLHGPFLYNMLRLSFACFGDSFYAARIPVAIAGTLLIVVPLLFRKYLSNTVTMGLMVFLALSPTMIYWSRFLREDFFVVGAHLVVLYGVLIAKKENRPFWVTVGLGLHICMKANIFVTYAIVIGYLFYEALIVWFIPKLRIPEKKTLLAKTCSSALTNWRSLIAGLLVSSVIVVFLYSAGFRYFGTPETISKSVLGSQTVNDAPWPAQVTSAVLYTLFEKVPYAGLLQGPLDGLFFKSFLYWFNQNSIERIVGQFLFHIYFLGWYETIFVLSIFAVVIAFYAKAERSVQLLGLGGLILAFIAGFYGGLVEPLSGLAAAVGIAGTGPDIATTFPWKQFHCKDALDVFGCMLMIAQAVIIPTTYIFRGERTLAFFSYLFWAFLFTYSYLGEKVPWLSMYPLLAGLLYVALVVERNLPEISGFLSRLIPSSSVLVWTGFAASVLGMIFILETDDSGELLDNVTWICYGLTLAAIGYALAWARISIPLNLGRTIGVVAIAFSVRAAIQVNFMYAGEAREFISQVHTTYDLHKLMMHIREEWKSGSMGKRPTILAAGEATWPVTWYLRDIDGYKFSSSDAERATFDYLLINEDQPGLPGFKKMTLPLRGWWVPDWKKLTLKRYLRYMLNHTTWSTVGYQNVNLLVKEKP